MKSTLNLINPICNAGLCLHHRNVVCYYQRMNKQTHTTARLCAICRTELKPPQKRCCSQKCVNVLGATTFRAKTIGTGKTHIKIRINGKQVYLHRYLVETNIRPLKDGEIVHHKDGNRFNNALSNLEILSGKSAHAKIHQSINSKRFQSVPDEIEIEVFGF